MTSEFELKSIRHALEELSRTMVLMNKNLCRIADILENNTSFTGSEGAFVIKDNTKRE
jgi:hypothetical protein